MLGNRDVTGLSIHEIFKGDDIKQLIRLLNKAIRDKQSINTPPLRASLGSEDSPQDDRFIHTLVPITDETGTTVHRLFIYSEKTV